MTVFKAKTRLREILYENEVKFSKTGKTSAKSTGSRKKLFRSFTFYGDLYDWIFKKKTTSTFDDVNDQLRAAGLPTMKDLAEKYNTGQKDTLKRIGFTGPLVGQTYSLYDISALAKNFNTNLGMYASLDELGNPVAIVKATIKGNEFRKSNYPDEWIDPSHTRMRYFLQREDESVEFNFHNKVNRLIFDGILKGMPVPIHLFYKEWKEEDYRYAGVFLAESLTPDRKAFDILKQNPSLPLNTRKEQVQLLKQFTEKLPSVWEKKKIVLVHPPKGVGASSVRPTIDRDVIWEGDPGYEEANELKKLIGDLGEQEALRIEKERLQKWPDLVERIQKVKLDSEGFDIRSFDVRGGDARDVMIEVKTTTSPSVSCPFFMSENERRTMVENPEDYWLYRIYDTHGPNIKYFALKERVADKLQLTATNYKVTVR